MFIGGYVSASGVGLTCPKWPLCPKGLIPMKEFIIEYFHRTVAITTSMLIFFTMVSILKNHRKIPRFVQASSIIAVCLAVVQISLGGIVIVEKLHALLVTIHLGVGLALFSMTIMPVLYAWGIFKPNTIKDSLLPQTDNISKHEEKYGSQGSIENP
ncbi:MAG TPA: COX15/CtaA family protein [Nitrososphaeraceae archaeon]